MTTRSASFDVAAISLSGLCVIHCLALPLASAALPVAGVLAEAEWVHKALVLAAWPISGIAIWRSLSMRALWPFSAAAGTGLIVLTAAAFVEALHDHETALTVAGAVILASAHVWRWTRRFH
ncbi:MerC domain-containing protein [Maricaulaceae bacterium NA33B04]|nr:MerC domain-containing protein [Maricaulaceae bacterium NA33B04]